jgi:hypothetical protein
MPYYRLGQNDQQKSSWVLYEVIKRIPQPKRPKEIPGVVSRLLGKRSDAELRMKDQYRALCCPQCGRYDSYQMYEVGFDDPVQIRIKGDFAHTDDRILVINEKFLAVLKAEKVSGYETKPVGQGGWHALYVTLQVNHSSDVVTLRAPNCSLCGRPTESFGLFTNENELTLPEEDNVLFTTKGSWPRAFSDRDIFVTEKVAKALKLAGIKGGYCSKLWTDAEIQKRDEKAAKGVTWKPPGMTIYI